MASAARAERRFGPRTNTAWRPPWIEYTYPDGSVAADGEVLEIEPGRRVAMSFHPRWSPEIEAGGPVRMTWAIEPGEGPDAPARLVDTTAIVPGSQVEAEFTGGIVFHRVGHQDGPRDGAVPGRRLT